MKTAIYTLCAIITAYTGLNVARAVRPSDQATLVYANGQTCEGEWYFGRTPTDRVFWTGGDTCAATYAQCVKGYVVDNGGNARKVRECSPDSQESRGRRAYYK